MVYTQQTAQYEINWSNAERAKATESETEQRQREGREKERENERVRGGRAIESDREFNSLRFCFVLLFLFCCFLIFCVEQIVRGVWSVCGMRWCVIYFSY